MSIPFTVYCEQSKKGSFGLPFFRTFVLLAGKQEIWFSLSFYCEP